MTAGERAELTTMWRGWCFSPIDIRTMTVCTNPKGHAGPHACEFAKLDRFHELRRAALVA